MLFQVDQSRASFDFVGAKVMEALKTVIRTTRDSTDLQSRYRAISLRFELQMEADIGKEVYVTHNLTKLSTKIGHVTKRFNELEEGIIEVRSQIITLYKALKYTCTKSNSRTAGPSEPQHGERDRGNSLGHQRGGSPYPNRPEQGQVPDGRWSPAAAAASATSAEPPAQQGNVSESIGLGSGRGGSCPAGRTDRARVQVHGCADEHEIPLAEVQVAGTRARRRSAQRAEK